MRSSKINYLSGVALGLALAGTGSQFLHKNTVAAMTDMDENVSYLENNLPADDFNAIKKEIHCAILNPTCSSVAEPFNWQTIAKAVKTRVTGESAEVAARRALDIIR